MTGCHETIGMNIEHSTSNVEHSISNIEKLMKREKAEVLERYMKDPDRIKDAVLNS